MSIVRLDQDEAARFLMKWGPTQGWVVRPDATLLLGEYGPVSGKLMGVLMMCGNELTNLATASVYRQWGTATTLLRSMRRRVRGPIKTHAHVSNTASLVCLLKFGFVPAAVTREGGESFVDLVLPAGRRAGRGRRR